jgi:hypothetical protein
LNVKDAVAPSRASVDVVKASTARSRSSMSVRAGIAFRTGAFFQYSEHSVRRPPAGRDERRRNPVFLATIGLWIKQAFPVSDVPVRPERRGSFFPGVSYINVDAPEADLGVVRERTPIEI